MQNAAQIRNGPFIGLPLCRTVQEKNRLAENNSEAVVNLLHHFRLGSASGPIQPNIHRLSSPATRGNCPESQGQ